VSASIGPLRAADRDRWAALWTGYLTFYNAAVAPAIYTSTWSRILDPRGDIRALGARDDAGGLVGITHFFFHPHAWSAHDACYLQDLFVDPEARNRGHARALIEAVAGVARERPCHSLYWKTMEGNATARRLYDTVATHDGTIVYCYPLVPPLPGAATRG
jgi:GNAT superfamily N-acetyltransferase